MALTHLLDTSVYSQPIRDIPHEQVLNRWDVHREGDLCISSIVHAEVLQGLEQRQSVKYWRRYRELIEGRYAILPFDASVAETYSSIVCVLRRSGRSKPMADVMIASTALCHGLVLATLNVKDFEGIPGLLVENWGR